MRRRSRAVGKPVKTRRRKRVASKRGNASKAVPRSSVVGLSKKAAQFKRERDEALAQQTATSEILASISGSMTDAKPVLDTIVRNLLRRFGTRCVTVQLLRDGMIEMPAADGQPGFEGIMERYPRPLDDTTVGGQAMLSKQVVQYSPVVGNPIVALAAQQLARDFDYNSIIAAPMGKILNRKTFVEASVPLKVHGSIMQILVGPNAAHGAENMVSDLLKEHGYPDGIPVRRSSAAVELN